MEKMESTLSKALVKALSELKNPQPTKENPYFDCRYAPLNEILAQVRPIFAKHGLCIIQEISSPEDGQTIGVSTIFLHEGGESMRFSPLRLKLQKMSPQAAGSLITYARRYSLCGALGIAADEDEDANISEKAISKKESLEKKEERGLATEKQLKYLYAIAKEREVPGEVLKEYIRNITDKYPDGRSIITKEAFKKALEWVESRETTDEMIFGGDE